MRADIVPGATFPDYELTDHRGKRRKLSALQGPDPMVVVLSRGAFIVSCWAAAAWTPASSARLSPRLITHAFFTFDQTSGPTPITGAQ